MTQKHSKDVEVDTQLEGEVEAPTTLRDEFAMAALPALIAKSTVDRHTASGDDEIARLCYRQADALMVARGTPGAGVPIGGEGIPGPMGPTGATGPAGPKGDTGDVGAVGAVGATGVGEPGLQGATGATGPEGPIGPTGPQGPEGPIGPTGPAGADAPAAMSASVSGLGTEKEEQQALKDYEKHTHTKA